MFNISDFKKNVFNNSSKAELSRGLSQKKQRIDLPDYLPIIKNHYYLSEYMEGKIDQDKLISSIVKSVKPLIKNSYRSRRMLDMINELGEFLYDEMRKVKAKLLE